jgi:hypothetical protein
MGSLSKFLGEPKEVEINGKKTIIHPLKVKDMSKFSVKNASEEEKAKISREMIKLSIPDTTDEEIESLPLDVFLKLIEEINKLNGFKDERLDKIKERIKQSKQ